MKSPLFHVSVKRVTSRGRTRDDAIWFSSMFRDYFTWWVRQMRGLLPAGLIAADGKSRDVLLLEPSGDQTSFSMMLRRGGRLTTLGRFKTDSAGLSAAKSAASETRVAAIWLSLPAEMLLGKRLALPLVAEGELQHVLSYEMDRETPFSVDEVWWGWQIIGRDSRRGQLDLRLFIVPKASLVVLTDALANAGLKPTEIDVPLDNGKRFQMSVDRRRRRDGFRGRLAPLAVVCLALAVAAVVVPFARQAIALGKVENRIAKLQPDIDRVQKLRGQLGGSAGTANGPTSGAEILRALAKITAVLPDDTYLTDFSFRQRKISLSGQSAAAAKLIGAIAADPYFKDPAFSAAVTRVQGAKLEAFSINAEIRP